MNKADLAEQLAKKHEISVPTANSYVGSVFELITEALANDLRAQFNGFGTFEVKYAEERAGINPKTGEPLTISARNKVTFHAGDALKKAVNP